MPDKNSREWTDDAAFWDDAWADMERRLDAPPERKAAFVWWPLLVAGGFLLLTLGIIGTTDAWPGTPRTIAVPSPTLPAEPTALTPTASVPAEQARVSQPPTTLPPPQPSASPVTLRQTARKAAEPQLAAAPVSPATPRVVDEVAQSATTVQQTQAERSQETTLTEARKAVIAPPDRPSPPPASQPLAVTIDALPGTAVARPQVQVTRTPLSHPLYVEAGVSTHPGIDKGGFYGGLTYVLPTCHRWCFPVGLHLRRDDLRIKSIGPTEAVTTSNDLGLPVTTPGANPVTDRVAAAEDLLADLEDTGFDELRTLGLELRAGAEYSIGERWRLSTGLGLEYLLAAQGPVITSDSTGYFSLGGTRNFTSLNVGNSPNYELLQNASGGSGEAASSGVDRWATRVYLGVRYQLSPRWEITADLSRLLRNIYDPQLANLQREQVRVSARWRLR